MEYLKYFGLLLLLPIASRLLFNRWRRRSNEPPGPSRLPIIGNLHNVALAAGAPHKLLAQLAKIHGPLMSLKLASLTTIVVSSPSMAQQILQKDDLVFSNRWVSDAVRSHRHHEFSIVFQPTNLAWKNLRKICNLQLFSNTCLAATQHVRQKKVEELVLHLHRCCEAGVSVNIAQVVFSLTLDMISKTLFSMDLDDDSLDSAFHREFKETIGEVLHLLGKPNIVDYFPVLKALDPQRIRHQMDRHFGKMLDFFRRLIDQRLAQGIDPSAENSDVLGVLLKLNQDNTDDHFGMNYIIHSLVDLYIGGTETTSNTVEWAMTELLRDRNKLKKAQTELDRVIGRGNPVKEGDIARLPYLEAVMKETLRLHPPLPFLVPRVTTSDVVLRGFNVPKDSQVLVNVWAIGRDPSVWEKPLCFEPERFLGSEIDVKGFHFELAPFGGGRRSCPGLPLAGRNLILILGSLIHSVDWKLEDGVRPETMDMDEKFGVVVRKATPLVAIPCSNGF